MTRAVLDAAPPRTRPQPPPPGARHARGFVGSASQVLASQVVLALAGLATLPVLGRQLGREHYGDFSLFVTLLGVVTYQDVARQLLIHEQAHERASAADLDALARLSTTLIVALALAVGVFVLEPASAAALVLATLLHGLASRDYALLAVDGRVGSATAVRNFAWALAFAGVAGASLVWSSPVAYAAPFVLANGSVAAAYRGLAGPHRLGASAPGAWWARMSGWAHLRRSPQWPLWRAAALDLLSVTIAASAIASLDRVLLDWSGGGAQLGLYCGAADLALRVHVVSSALAAALYPMLASLLHERGREVAARRFVSIASWVVPAYFAGLVALLLFDRALLRVFLGPEFAAAQPLFALLAVGLFVHAFGFLLTPWQRAQGDFESQRVAYTRAALLMLAAGIVLVPLYGALGAALSYLVSRFAELQLLARELPRLPREILPRRRLVAAAAMFAALVALAAWRIHGAG